MFFPLFHQLMVLDEFPYELQPTREQALLADIRHHGELFAAKLTARSSPGQQYGTVRRRTRWHLLPIGGTRMRIWHLNLYHPLWLGGDGQVYRHYESLTGNSYFMEAELHERDERGLERVLDAVMRLEDTYEVVDPAIQFL